MNKSRHRVGEWQVRTYVIPTIYGPLPVPCIATDVESAEKCVRFSLALLARALESAQKADG